MEGAAVGADPFGGEAAGLAGADVPFGGVIDRGPGSPGLGGVVDAEAAGEAGVFAGAGLAPKGALKRSVVADAAAVAETGGLEDGAALADVGRPFGGAVGLATDEKFIGGAVAEAILGDAAQDHAVGALVGAVAILRIDIDVVVASAGVGFAEIQEGGAAEARFEFPIGPLPGAAFIARPA